MRRAAIYARVSTRHQEKEATIESQIEQLLTYAQAQGYELASAHIFADQAISGAYLARPALDRLRDAAAAGEFDVVLILSPDRLARSLGVQCVVLEELSREGIEVIFLNQPDLGQDPLAKLFLGWQGIYYEFERTRISEQLRRGRLYRLRHGLSVPHQAPYGYRYQPATVEHPNAWVIVSEQAAIVQQAFAWYTEEGISLEEIARRLNRRQVPGPAGGRWNANTVGRMLRQPAYKGTAYYCRHRSDHGSLGRHRRQGRGALQYPRQVLRPVEEWIEIAVPPLVDEAVWQAAQERLEMNTRFARRNSRHPYLLRGLLVCGTCGHTLQGRTDKGGIVRYSCSYGGVHCPAGVPRHSCCVRGDMVEPLVWGALADLLREPQRIRESWEALNHEPSVVPDEHRRWQHRRDLLAKQRQRLLDAYQAGAISLEEFTARQNPLQVELRELEKRLAGSPQGEPSQISLELFTQRIEQALTASDVETRQEVLRLLIERIVVTDEALIVEHIVPTVNECRLHNTLCDA